METNIISEKRLIQIETSSGNIIIKAEILAEGTTIKKMNNGVVLIGGSHVANISMLNDMISFNINSAQNPGFAAYPAPGTQPAPGIADDSKFAAAAADLTAICGVLPQFLIDVQTKVNS